MIVDVTKFLKANMTKSLFTSKFLDILYSSLTSTQIDESDDEDKTKFITIWHASFVAIDTSIINTLINNNDSSRLYFRQVEMSTKAIVMFPMPLNILEWQFKETTKLVTPLLDNYQWKSYLIQRTISITFLFTNFMLYSSNLKNIEEWLIENTFNDRRSFFENNKSKDSTS